MSDREIYVLQIWDNWSSLSQIHKAIGILSMDTSSVVLLETTHVVDIVLFH